MKKPLVLLVTLLGLGTLTPLAAEAAPDRRPPVRQETKVTHDRHGHPIHWVKEYKGRDRKGRPVFAWVRDTRRAPAARGHDHGRDSRDSRDRDKKGNRKSIFKFLFRN